MATAPAIPATAKSPPARIVIGWGLVATNASAPTLPRAGRIDCQPPPPLGPRSAGGAASFTGSDGTGGGRRRTGRCSGIRGTAAGRYRWTGDDPARPATGNPESV